MDDDLSDVFDAEIWDDYVDGENPCVYDTFDDAYDLSFVKVSPIQ